MDSLFISQVLVSLEECEIPVKPLTSELAMVSLRGTRSDRIGRIGGVVLSWVLVIHKLILSILSAWETGQSAGVGRRISAGSRSMSSVALSGWLPTVKDFEE